MVEVETDALVGFAIFLSFSLIWDNQEPYTTWSLFASFFPGYVGHRHFVCQRQKKNPTYRYSMIIRQRGVEFFPR